MVVPKITAYISRLKPETQERILKYRSSLTQEQCDNEKRLDDEYDQMKWTCTISAKR